MARMFEIAFELAGKVGSSFDGAFGSANSVLQKMQRQVSSLRSDIRDLEKAQKAGSITAEEYASSHAKLTQQLQRAEQAQKNLGKAVNLQNRVTAFRGQMRAGMLGAIEAGVAVGAPAKMAMDFESAMADVRKVIDFDTPQQFKAMGNDILTLSKRIPMAANGLAQIVAAGGQAGIARDELLGYAEAAAKMGVAFDVSAEEAGQTMAEWRSAFKMNQDQVNTLADQINYLGNTTAASAPKISDVVRRIGPLGEVGGAAAAQIAALGATMVSAGIQEEVAATGIKNLILGLTAGEGATKSQAAAFKALGLDAGKMAQLMQKDAQGAILKVLQSLQKLPKYKQAAVLSDLFGKESIGAIAPLLTNLDALQANFARVGDKAQYAGSMQKEFESRSATAANSLQLLKNRAVALGTAIGDIMLPYITDISAKLSAATDWVQKFSEEHPVLAQRLVLGMTAALGLSAALAGLGYVTSSLITPFVSFFVWAQKVQLISRLGAAASAAWAAAQWLWNGAMTVGQALLSVGRLAAYYAMMGLVNVATKAWAAAQWLLNAAMSANPIGLVIAGIGALIGAGYLLISNWETVKSWFITLWNDPLAALQQFIDAIRRKFAGVIGWLEEKWNKLKSIFGLGGGDASTSVTVPGHAAGGIFDKPHIAAFAEKGPEAAIPLDGSSRALSLWAKTGALLGAAPRAAGIQLTYAPVINAPGGDPGVIRQALKESRDDFMERFQAMLRQERRLSYA